MRFLALLAVLAFLTPAHAEPKAQNYWNVDDIRAGMKGLGKSVIKGIKIETFDAEVLGVLRNTAPGRDLILCRLSGMNLDKSGVIQGMSGSPIYVAGKLLGAVAYAWPYGKEPIAGVTPFAQMREFVEAYERRDVADKAKPSRVGLASPLRIGERSYDSVTVSHDFADASTASADGITLVPLRTPVAVSGFSANSLALLKDTFAGVGMVPMQGGAASSINLPPEERNPRIEPGAALAIGMVMGDFDMSGIGTVTHVEGKRVYGWGHPLFGGGGCEMPLMTGYTHLIFPRHTLSFKMGSPLQTVGIINADVSTCIAGWLDRPVDLLPVKATVKRDAESPSRTFNVKMIRQKQMLPGLVNAVLTNAIDMEGDLPDEATASMKLKIAFENHEPIVLEDRFSGPTLTGSRGPQALYSQAVMLLQMLGANSFENVRLKAIECATEISPGRRTAEIEAVEVDSELLAPGEKLKATVWLRPYRAPRQRVNLELALPSDLPEGSYTATIGDDLANARQELRDKPHLAAPQNVNHMMESLQLIAAAKRTNLVLRVPTPDVGVALNGQALPNLPASMVHILGTGRRTGAQTIAGSLVARQPTDWVVQGSDSFRFTVSRNKKLSPVEP